MKIEINPTNLPRLESICEVLYKLHPNVLENLVEMNRSLGDVLGMIDHNNMTLKEREFLCSIKEEVDFSKDDLEGKVIEIEDEDEDKDSENFRYFLRYLKLNTDEYIPIKIFVEVEDHVIGRKVRELVRALEKTRAPEQFYFNKREEDEYAYFAEGYGLRMNDEQKKKYKDFLNKKDYDNLRKILEKEKLIEV